MVVGPLCTGLDIFPGVLNTVPEPGGLLAVLDLGAYWIHPGDAPVPFHPSPAEVAIHDGRAELVRRLLEPEELLATQRMPS
jgi:hypothetical protein